MAGYFTETVFEAKDKVSPTLAKIIKSLEDTEIASKSLIASLDKLTLGFTELGKIAKVAGSEASAAFTGLNRALSTANTRMMTFDERGVFAGKVLRNINTQAVHAAAGMNTLGASSKAAMSSMKQVSIGMKSGGTGGGSHGGGIMGKLGRLPGHIVNHVFDAWMMEQVLGGAVESPKHRENAITRMGNAGFSKAEQARAIEQARKITKLVPSTSITGNIEQILDLALGMQNVQAGIDLAPTLLSNSAMMSFMTKEGGKGIDEKTAGATGRIMEMMAYQKRSAADKQHLVELIARSTVSTKGVANAPALQQYLQNMGPSRMGKNIDQLFYEASYQIQELRNRAGSQSAAFNRALLYGTMTKGAAEDLIAGGLLPPEGKDTGTLKGGQTAVRRYVTKNLFGRDLLKEGGDKYSRFALDKMLEHKHMSKDQFEKMPVSKQQDFIMDTFGGMRQLASGFADMMIMQRHSLKEHKKFFWGPDLRGAKDRTQQTIEKKQEAVMAAWDDFMGTLGTNTAVLNTIKGTLDAITATLRGMESGLRTMNQMFPATAVSLSDLGHQLFSAKGSVSILASSFTKLAPIIDRIITTVLKAFPEPTDVSGKIAQPDSSHMPTTPQGKILRGMLEDPLGTASALIGHYPIPASKKRGSLFNFPPPPPMPAGSYLVDPPAAIPANKALSQNPHLGNQAPIVVNVNAPIHGNVNMPDFQKFLTETVNKGVQKGIQQNSRQQRNTALKYANTNSQSNNPIIPVGQTK